MRPLVSVAAGLCVYGLDAWSQQGMGAMETGSRLIVLNTANTQGGSVPEARIYSVDTATGSVSGFASFSRFDTGAMQNHLVVVKLP